MKDLGKRRPMNAAEPAFREDEPEDTRSWGRFEVFLAEKIPRIQKTSEPILEAFLWMSADLVSVFWQRIRKKKKEPRNRGSFVERDQDVGGIEPRAQAISAGMPSAAFSDASVGAFGSPSSSGTASDFMSNQAGSNDR